MDARISCGIRRVRRTTVQETSARASNVLDFLLHRYLAEPVAWMTPRSRLSEPSTSRATWLRASSREYEQVNSAFCTSLSSSVCFALTTSLFHSDTPPKNCAVRTSYSMQSCTSWPSAGSVSRVVHVLLQGSGKG